MRAAATDRRVTLPPLSAWTLTGGATWDPVDGIWLPGVDALAASPLIPVPTWATRAGWAPGISTSVGTRYCRMDGYRQDRAMITGSVGWSSISNWTIPSGTAWLGLSAYPHANGLTSWWLPHGGILTFT